MKAGSKHRADSHALTRGFGHHRAANLHNSCLATCKPAANQGSDMQEGLSMCRKGAPGLLGARYGLHKLAPAKQVSQVELPGAAHAPERARLIGRHMQRVQECNHALPHTGRHSRMQRPCSKYQFQFKNFTDSPFIIAQPRRINFASTRRLKGRSCLTFIL